MVCSCKGSGLTSALEVVKPGKKAGPWKALCDNESFLDHAESVKAYRRPRTTLVHIPAKSSDLNPVEKFWGWARKKLHKMDFTSRASCSMQDCIQRENQKLAHCSECTAEGQEFVWEPQNGGEEDRSEERSWCERLKALLRMCGHAIGHH